jgi:hypothetical protein
MFRRYLTGSPVALMGCSFAPVDNGSGGGESAADATSDTTTQDDPAADRGSDGDGGDGADGDDDDLGALAPDELDALPERNLKTRVRRLSKHLSKARPIADRFRGPNGRFLPAEEIDGIISDSRQFRNIDSVFRGSKRALDVFLEEQARLERGGASPADAAAEAADDAPEKMFDPATWEYETDTPAGKKLAKLAQAFDEERARNRRLEKQLGQFGQQRQAETETAVEERFKTSTLSAATKLPANLRQGFVDLVYERFLNLKSSGQLGKAKAEEVIQRSLKSFGVTGSAPASAARTPATTRASAMAADNRGLPRVPRPGVVSPADRASAPKTRETLADSRKNFYGRLERTPPPGR